MQERVFMFYDVVELSCGNVSIFFKGWYNESFNMQETIFNVSMEGCLAFLWYVKTMCYEGCLSG